MIITIDGPSGTGKSTVAKAIAKKLGFTYVDTGAMFRSFAFGLIQKKIDLDNATSVVDFVKNTPLAIEGTALNKRFLLDQIDVTDMIRSQEVADAASKISTIPEVREVMKQLQQSFGKNHDAIFCGRDMGTVIFPHAELKIYLTASPRVQAERRYKELAQKQERVSFTIEEIEMEIRERDQRDQNRAIAPLMPARDAHVIDTSSMSIDEVTDTILALWTTVL